jgi:hypothetical protein
MRKPGDNFARQVDTLFARALADKPYDARNEGREVREVAFALAQLRSLTDGAVEKVGLKGLPETALVAASDLLDALMSGTEHPIWRYIEEGRRRKRANKAPASRIDTLRRGLLVGLLRALQWDAVPPARSRRAAARRIADQAAVLGVRLTADQIIGWDKLFPKDEQISLPNGVRGDILRLAATRDQDTILKAGISRAYFLWALPNRMS